MDNIIKHNTPWEKYDCWNLPVWVKREDLSCEDGPAFSKLRGLERHIKDWDGPIGILDTLHSKAGWGVSWLCEKMYKGPVFNFYPKYKGEVSLRYNQRQSQYYGAILAELPAGRSAILLHRAKKLLSEWTNGRGLMLPNGLQLDESVEATADEVVDYTPNNLMCGTWIISVSTGTIVAGVVSGLSKLGVLQDIDVIIHMGYSHSHDSIKRKIGYNDIIIVDEGYQYKDKVDVVCPFPCNEYYDLKAWKWLSWNIDKLKQPVVFWNIGA